MQYEFLYLIGGAVCLSIGLLEAWLLAVRFSSESGWAARLFPEKQQLVKSHIDYLLMSMFLFIFFMLTQSIGVPPGWTIICACVGALLNPFGFLWRAIRPDLLKHPTALYKGVLVFSFVCTTLGFFAVVLQAFCYAIARL